MAQTSSQKCYICTENYSVFYCYECQHALCAVCRERHDKIPAVSGHNITDINVIDLSNVQSDNTRCTTHVKEYQFYCVKCSDIICGKCATSSHKGHSFSDISEIVLEKREAAQSALQNLKSKIDVITSVQDTVKSTHIEKLHFNSQQVITDIASTFEELQTFTNSKKDIKETEVEDNERIEQQNIELFLKNTDLIHVQYVQVFTALQNILSEKHDITFYKLYRPIDKEITFLDDIPKEPTLPSVPSLNKTMIYTEIVEYIQSKTDTSLCENCFTTKEKLVKILEENEQVQRDVDDKAVELQAESNEVRRLRISFRDMEIKYAKKEEENESLSKELRLLKESLCKDCITKEETLVQILDENKQLKRDVDEKAVELKAELNEVRRLRISFKDMEIKYAKKEEENESLTKEIRSLKKGISTKTQRKITSKAKQTSYSDYLPGTGVLRRTQSSTQVSTDDVCFYCTCGKRIFSNSKFCDGCGKKWN